MEYTRKNKGVCSASTKVVIEDGIVKDVEMLGGCNGNIKGLIALVKGMKAEEAIERLSGIRCGFRKPYELRNQQKKDKNSLQWCRADKSY